MKIIDMRKPHDRVFDALRIDPIAVRALFEAFIFKAPWMGWAPMLCEITRRVKKAAEEPPVSSRDAEEELRAQIATLQADNKKLEKLRTLDRAELRIERQRRFSAEACAEGSGDWAAHKARWEEG